MSIVVAFSGILMDFNEVHPEKAEPLIIFMEEDSDIDDKTLHEAKILVPIDVTDCGMMTLFRVEHE